MNRSIRELYARLPRTPENRPVLDALGAYLTADAIALASCGEKVYDGYEAIIEEKRLRAREALLDALLPLV